MDLCLDCHDTNTSTINSEINRKYGQKCVNLILTMNIFKYYFNQKGISHKLMSPRYLYA